MRSELVIGFILVTISALGVVQGVRAGIAQAIHCSIRYGSDSEEVSPEVASQACEKAHRSYPYNYYLCTWISEKAYYNRFDEEGKEIEGRRDIAGAWCARGLALNKRKSQLRLMNTRFIAEKSVPDAIAYWKEYVEWDFWDPYSHAVLVDYYVDVGDLEGATSELEWVKGSPHYKDSSRRLLEAWKQDMEIPDSQP